MSGYIKFDGVDGESTDATFDTSDSFQFTYDEEEAGRTADDAYFVRTDASTTTQSGDDEAEDSIVVDYGAIKIEYFDADAGGEDALMYF